MNSAPVPTRRCSKCLLFVSERAFSLQQWSYRADRRRCTSCTNSPPRSRVMDTILPSWDAMMATYGDTADEVMLAQTPDGSRGIALRAHFAADPKLAPEGAAAVARAAAQSVAPLAALAEAPPRR